MEKKKGLGLNFKFIIVFAPIVAIVIGVVLVFLFLTIHNGIYNLQRQNMVQSSDQLKDELDTIIADISSLVYLNSTRNVVQTELTNQRYDRMQEVCERQLELNPYLEAVMAADRNGKLIAHTDEGSVGLDITVFPFWKGVREQRVHVDKVPYESPVTGHSVFVIASAVYDYKGDFVGLFAMPVDLNLISREFLQGKTYGQDGYPVVFDREGLVIAHPDETILLDTLPELEHIYTSGMVEGFESYQFRGDKKYMAFHTVEKVDWYVSATITEADMLELSRRVMIIVLIVGGVAFVILLAIIILSLRFLVIKPVNQLSNVVIDVSKGIVSNRKVHTKSKDEVGILIERFNVMIDFFQERNELMREVAGGNLTVEVKLASDEDEVGKALEYMVDSLNRVVSEINVSIEQISNGSNQISDSSQNLSSGATSQASSIEEITASINEITTQVQQNVENAQKVDQLINKAKENADMGNDKMEELIQAIEGINKSSEDIRDIVKVIDDIAFQTNLLALNADIEAARVGKYGRGFAVVATSVRNLASKSAESVKETTKNVEEIIKKIERGNDLVESTSAQLKQISRSTVELTKLTMEVSDASQEQANGIEQISNGLASIEDVVQNNSANAEENAAASEELNAQANKLQELMSFFITDKQAKFIQSPQRDTNKGTDITPYEKREDQEDEDNQ
jgi:methyl-accepting chemotaxis protein